MASGGGRADARLLKVHPSRAVSEAMSRNEPSLVENEKSVHNLRPRLRLEDCRIRLHSMEAANQPRRGESGRPTTQMTYAKTALFSVITISFIWQVCRYFVTL